MPRTIYLPSFIALAYYIHTPERLFALVPASCTLFMVLDFSISINPEAHVLLYQIAQSCHTNRTSNPL